MKLDHVGIAVRSIEQALRRYRDELKFTLSEVAAVPEQGVRVAMLLSGASFIELLEPTDVSSPIHKFLQKEGEGVHHLCFKVDNLEQKLQELAATSIQVLDSAACRGLDNRKVAFLHPKSVHGVLIELVEEP